MPLEGLIWRSPFRGRAIDASCGAKLRLDWCIRPEWDEWARHSEGWYVLRTNQSRRRRGPARERSLRIPPGHCPREVLEQGRRSLAAPPFDPDARDYRIRLPHPSSNAGLCRCRTPHRIAGGVRGRLLDERHGPLNAALLPHRTAQCVGPDFQFGRRKDFANLVRQ